MAGKNIYPRQKFWDFFCFYEPSDRPERLHNSFEAGHEVLLGVGAVNFEYRNLENGKQELQDQDELKKTLPFSNFKWFRS